MAYRAEIEIGVKGQRELERLRALITQTTQAYESLNKIASQRGALNQTLSNYETQLNRAKRAIDNVTMGTQAEVKAIREYVDAVGAANAARARQNYLIAQEISNRRRVQVAINAGFGQQGPALPPSMRNAGFGQQGPTLPRRGTSVEQTGRGSSGRLSGLVSSAVIGGAFPLLFGQGGGAATGGAIGGVIGGAFGGAGGFAGSLLGTLIGDLVSKGAQIKELAADIGFSAEQTRQLQTAFKLAGQDADKFTEAVQNIRGVGLAIEDQAKAIQLVSALTEAYGGNIVKVTNALTGALETGKVTQATLNQLTSQGINVQDALAIKYKTSRDNILLMAKDGKISVQNLIDVLTEIGNAGVTSSNKVKSSFASSAAVISQAFDSAGPKVQSAFDKLLQTGTDAASRLVDALLPVITTLISISAEVITLGSNFASAFAGIPGYVEAVTTAVINLIPGINLLNTALSFMRTFKGKPSAQESGMYGRYIPGDQQRQTLKTFAAPSQYVPTSKAKKDRTGEDAAKEAARVAKAIRDRQAETQLLAIQAGLQDRIFQAEQQKDALTSARLKGELDILNIQFQYAQDLANEKNVRVQEAIVAKGLQEVENARLKNAQTLQEIETNRTEKYNEILADLEYEKQLQDATTEQAKERLRIEYEMRKLQKEGIYSPDQLSEIGRAHV